MLSVAQNYVSDIAYAKTVHQNGTCSDAADGRNAVYAYLNHPAEFRNKHILFIHPHGNSGGSMNFKVLVFAVKRNEILRFSQGNHQLFFILTGVS